MPTQPPVEVVAAAIADPRGRILLARRTAGRDLAGLWEFPGGKREPGETPEQALIRELDEELGIQVQVGSPLIAVPQAWPGKRLRLDVRRVSAWKGIPRGHEGQALAWVPPHRLASYAMPPADIPVVAALTQPDRYLVTPPPQGVGGVAPTYETAHHPTGGDVAPDTAHHSTGGDVAPVGRPHAADAGDAWLAANAGEPDSRDVGGVAPTYETAHHPTGGEVAPVGRPHAADAEWLAGIERALANGIRRLHLRLPGPGPGADAGAAGAARPPDPGIAAARRESLIRQAVALAHAAGAEAFVGGDIELARATGAGVHLRAAQLAGLHKRPLPAALPVAASCHDEAELHHAQRLGCDFAVLGPVKPTPTHPEAGGLGWTRFAALRETVSLPIYAIGGLTPADIPHARQHGAQGIAAIRALWPK